MRRFLLTVLASLLLMGCERSTVNDKPFPATNSNTTDNEVPPPITGGTVQPPLTSGGTAVPQDAPSEGEPKSGSPETIDDTTRPVPADNTKVNQRDQGAAAVLPTDQGENQTDIDTTAEIRRKIVDLDNLSISARNVKVITRDGKVTLRGPVASEEERKTIADIARNVAGPGNVSDQLEITDQ